MNWPLLVRAIFRNNLVTQKEVAMFRPEPNSGTPVRMPERKEKIGTLESPEIPALIAPHWAQF